MIAAFGVLGNRIQRSPVPCIHRGSSSFSHARCNRRAGFLMVVRATRFGSALRLRQVTPAEIDALADEIMQDTLMAEADAYEEAVTLYPSLYLAAQDWDFAALAAGNDAAAF